MGYGRKNMLMIRKVLEDNGVEIIEIPQKVYHNAHDDAYDIVGYVYKIGGMELKGVNTKELASRRYIQQKGVDINWLYNLVEAIENHDITFNQEKNLHTIYNNETYNVIQIFTKKGWKNSYIIEDIRIDKDVNKNLKMLISHLFANETTLIIKEEIN